MGPKEIKLVLGQVPKSISTLLLVSVFPVFISYRVFSEVSKCIHLIRKRVTHTSFAEASPCVTNPRKVTLCKGTNQESHGKGHRQHIAPSESIWGILRSRNSCKARTIRSMLYSKHRYSTPAYVTARITQPDPSDD